jgi:hypothetical protein
MYFYWVPLTFIIGDLFRGKDITRLIRQTLLFAIPISVLCYIQFKSPADAWINKTYTGEASICTVDWHTVRPALTFSFPSATPIFVGFIASMVVALWLLPNNQRPLSNKVFLLSCIALLVLTAFNGNRTLWFNLIFCLIAGLVAASQLALSKRSLRSLISLTVACVAGGIFMNFFCADGVNLIATKYNRSEGTESDTVGARILCNFVEIAGAVDTTPMYGWGIGVGSGGGSILATGQRAFTMGETEWLRNYQECGLLGLVFIILRGTLAFVVAKDAWAAVKRTKNPFPLTLCAMAVPLLVIGSVTIASTINALGWFITGVQIAVNRLNTRDTKTVNQLPKVEIGQG